MFNYSIYLFILYSLTASICVGNHDDDTFNLFWNSCHTNRGHLTTSTTRYSNIQIQSFPSFLLCIIYWSWSCIICRFAKERKETEGEHRIPQLIQKKEEKTWNGMSTRGRFVVVSTFSSFLFDQKCLFLSSKEGAVSAPTSPGLSKQAPASVNVLAVSSSNTSNTLPADMPKKRRAPQPPMVASQSVPNNLSSCHLSGAQVGWRGSLFFFFLLPLRNNWLKDVSQSHEETDILQ